jgi:hypothetical protein
MGWTMLKAAGTTSETMAQHEQDPAPEAPKGIARVIIIEDDERLRAYALSAMRAALPKASRWST